MRPAIDAFQEALRLHPDYAEAYGSLALAYAKANGLGINATQARQLSVAAAEKALSLDPAVIDAHLALVSIAALWDYERTAFEKQILRFFRREFEKCPSFLRRTPTRRAVDSHKGARYRRAACACTFAFRQETQRSRLTRN